MSIKVLYFASLRETLGYTHETLTLPASIATQRSEARTCAYSVVIRFESTKYLTIHPLMHASAHR